MSCSAGILWRNVHACLNRVGEGDPEDEQVMQAQDADVVAALSMSESEEDAEADVGVGGESPTVDAEARKPGQPQKMRESGPRQAPRRAPAAQGWLSLDPSTGVPGIDRLRGTAPVQCNGLQAAQTI